MKKKLLLLIVALLPMVVFADNKTLYDTVKDLSTGLDKDNVNFTGSGVTEFEEKGSKVYVYTGGDDDTNNFVRINDMCFTVLRTTYINGVKLMYYGNYENGKCVFDHQSGKFNENANHKNVGYMFGENNDLSYDITHANVNSSNIKNQLDTFYTNKLSNFTKWMSDDIYCNDREISEGDGYSIETKYKYYALKENQTYDLECRKHDSFTVKNEDGNTKLDKYIGTISVSEYMLTLSGPNGTGTAIYYTNDWMFSRYGEAWTMTASYSNTARERTTKPFSHKDVYSNEATIIPVISVNRRVFVRTGDGSDTNPYELYYDDGKIAGEIIWDDDNNKDGLRPSEVKITIFADDNKVDEITVKAADNWKFMINVENYTLSGSRITYKVSQDEINGYELSIDGNQTSGFTIVNKHKVKEEIKGVEENPETGRFNIIIIPMILILIMGISYHLVKRNDLFKSNYQ